MRSGQLKTSMGLDFVSALAESRKVKGLMVRPHWDYGVRVLPTIPMYITDTRGNQAHLSMEDFLSFDWMVMSEDGDLPPKKV
jgi:hypothetical protein